MFEWQKKGSKEQLEYLRDMLLRLQEPDSRPQARMSDNWMEGKRRRKDSGTTGSETNAEVFFAS